jgi:hypothetical protein
MVAADGIIYVFGSSVEEQDEAGEPKTVLWTFNTSKREL